MKIWDLLMRSHFHWVYYKALLFNSKPIRFFDSQMAINVHYCGKIVEYDTPKKRIHEKDIYTDKRRTFVYTAKQEIKITDAIFFALQNPSDHLYFVTLTYQWKPDVNYGLSFRKKANTHLNRFLKYIRDKRKVRRYVGVLELTKRGVPHYHIVLDCDLTKATQKSKNFMQRQTYYFLELQAHWNTITNNIYKNSLDYKQITKKDLRQNNGAYKICKYLTKYFTKELKIPKENRFNFGVRNYFISDKLRVKPIKIKSSSVMHSDFIEIQKKAQKKHNLYWNKCSKNQNWTENITYYENTASYWVLPYGLPPLNTAITRITHNIPFKTLYDRIKYVNDETI